MSLITVKSPAEIESMRIAGRVSKDALIYAGSLLVPGVTTAEVDKAVERFIRERGAIPSFLGYHNFPKSVCISINDEVIHGIPSHRKIVEGDVVSIDVGASYKGYHGDNAATFAVGKVSDEAKKLITVTRECFFAGMKFARKDARIGDISNAIQEHAERNGFSVVREFVGHGIGSSMHEPPEVPNFGKASRGPRLCAGMTLAIEPMINMGLAGVYVAGDGWTVLTRDGKLSAHYENTVLVTDGEPEILTVGCKEI